MRLRGLWLLLLVTLPLQAADHPPIDAIRFVGNETTRERILLQEMTVGVGDPADPEAIAHSRQAIMDLGLFKSVTALMQQEAGLRVLVVTVEERFYILPWPLLNAKPEGDYSYGAELRLDNVAGLNQRLKLSYEEKGSIDADEPKRNETALSYSYPRLRGSPYRFDLSLKLTRENLSPLDSLTDLPAGEYRYERYGSSVRLSRWLNDEGASRGWFYGFGVNARVDSYDFRSGERGLFDNTQSIGLIANTGYETIHEHPYYRDGIAFGINGEVGAPQLGSDYRYYLSTLYWRLYRPLVVDSSNFNMRLLAGFGHGNRFGTPLFGLGGNDSLRGYEGDYVTGNAYLLGNFEYAWQVSGYKQLRLVPFVDLGNAYSDIFAMNATDLKTSLGFELRWKVQSFVNLNLRIGYAYGVEAETQKAYASSGTAF